VFLGSNPNPNRLKKAASGYWEVTPAPAKALLSWFALNPRPSEASVDVEWPFGLGCSVVQGTVRGNEIHIPAIAAVMVIHNSRNAIIRYDDGTVLKLKKTRNDTSVVCE